MMRSSVFRMVLVTHCVFCLQASQLFNVCFAQPENEERDVLPLSTAPASGVSVRKMLSRTVQWEQQEYPASEGIQVLMGVITNARTEPDKRATALQKLGILGPRLHKTDRVPELIALYDTFADREERLRLIGCLAMSDDKRALPLFGRFLSEATDDFARFEGAYALARWNIRRGVAELVDLFESTELLPAAVRSRTHTPYLRDSAMEVFGILNTRKGWGLPEEEIARRIIEGRSDLNQDQKIALVIVEIKKWFADNERRFPDWKPDDPLPKLDYTPREAVIVAEGWKCDGLCRAPADFDDCATCCVTHDSCIYCCSPRTRGFEQLTDGQRAECISICDTAFGTPRREHSGPQPVRSRPSASAI